MGIAEKLRTISLCTGYGGIERGLELAGERIKHVVTCEIEAYAIAVNLSRMEKNQLEAHPIWTNLKTFPVESIPEGSVDLLTGGYPCQPFSTAGKRLGEKDPRHLWPYIKDIICSIQPFRCFFENVEGHVGQGLREVVGDLETIGYQTTWGIFSAAEVGAPHRRKRVFILADKQDKRRRRRADPDGNDRKGLPQLSEKQQSMVWGETSGRCGNLRNEELADSLHNGYNEASFCGKSKNKQNGVSESKQYGERLRDNFKHSNQFFGKWPARPGQEQYSWEAPRVLANTGLQRPTVSQEQTTGLKQQSKSKQQRTGKTKPGMGRAINGTTHRIDRLRMLGNGVVPQTAAKAWLVLNEELRKEKIK